MSIDDLSIEELREWIADWCIVSTFIIKVEAASFARASVETSILGTIWNADEWDEWWLLHDELLAAYAEATYEMRPACEGCRTRSTETDRHNCLVDEL